MALTLTIGGSNFLPQYKTNSFTKTEILQNRGNTAKIEITKKSSENAPEQGKELIFKNGTDFIFAGFVSKISPIEIGVGQLFIYDVEVTDYTYIIINKSAQKTYKSQTLSYIVNDLMTNYVDAGYGITTGGVEVGPTVDSVSFNHTSLRDCFEKLSKITGFEWWLGYDKVLYFKSKKATSAPEQITDSSNNHEALSIETDLAQVRNSIVVQGGKEETSTYSSQTIEADGVAREWILRDKPTTFEYIKEATVLQTVGEDPTDEETGNDYMYNMEEKYIRVISTDPTPSAGTLIEVSYKYEIPVIITLGNASSIAAMKALEGGDGIHAHTIFDSSIKSRAEARQRALKEIAEYGNPQVLGYFATRTGLLLTGSYFQPGQEVVINSPSWGISTDTKYLIQEVSTSLIQSGTDIEYHYIVRFGGRLIDAIIFLESLASKEDTVFATQEINKIEAITEEINITELITRDQYLKTISESVSIGENISQQNNTPPFEYGPAGSPQGVWNKSEWG